METIKKCIVSGRYKMFFVVCSFLVFNSANVMSQENIRRILTKANIDIPRLSPIPQEIHTIKDPVISLNGTWEVGINTADPKPVEVPGELIMQGYNLSIGETAHYQRRLDIPEEWRGMRVFIRFDAVSSNALVKLNGVPIAEHEGSFVPFEVEITKYIEIGQNLLQVEVQAHTISDILGCTSQYAAHTVAGILRKVSLFVLPESNIADITVTTGFDKNFVHSKMNIETKIDALDGDILKLDLRYTLSDAAGKVQVMKTFPVINNIKDGGYYTSDIVLNVHRPHHWTPESPYLYQLRTELIQDGQIIQENVQKVGFRQIDIKKGELLVNGRPVKLHGVNRHSVHPLSGRSITPELDRLDAKLFKEANCNYIRTSHYPPSEEFLEAADELGLFVESEASLTWIEHHASPMWGHWDYKDPKFLPYMLMANIENIQANKKHPSVIIWSIANESRWSPLWEQVIQVVKEMDPSRPNAFHDQCWGGFNNAGSRADIANYHYPGINGPIATDTMSRPVLFGEYAHLSTYNRRELLTDPGVRDAYNRPLVTFYDSIYVHRNNLGGAIWSGIDDTFHLPDGRIVGYGPWGPIDGWRRTKPEYFGMKKAYSPIKIKNSDLVNGRLRFLVENRYDFTSLKDIRIIAEVNGEEFDVKTNIPPRQQGFLIIPTKVKVDSLRLTFFDPLGFIAEEEFYDFKEDYPLEIAEKKELIYEENKDSYIIRQGIITYMISKLTGTVESVQKQSAPILINGPLFMIVPMNKEDGGKNNIAGETYQRNIQPLQNFPWYVKYASDIRINKAVDSITIATDISFKEGKGGVTYTFYNDGRFNIKYQIDNVFQETFSYQYGLVLVLPKTFQELTWKRKGDFTIYPKDHIGRNKGTASLNAVQTSGVEPWQTKPMNLWKDDANELGSNDFRSTKRNILNASLANNDGTKVTVLSNGKQASRSWLQEEAVHWLIADYSNNGSEPFYGTPHSNGRISLKDKILKGEITILIE